MFSILQKSKVYWFARMRLRFYGAAEFCIIPSASKTNDTCWTAYALTNFVLILYKFGEFVCLSASANLWNYGYNLIFFFVFYLIYLLRKVTWFLRYIVAMLFITSVEIFVLSNVAKQKRIDFLWRDRLWTWGLFIYK